MSPPNNQALAMPLPPRKKEENQETPKDESTAVDKNLQFQFLMMHRTLLDEN